MWAPLSQAVFSYFITWVALVLDFATSRIAGVQKFSGGPKAPARGGNRISFQLAIIQHRYNLICLDLAACAKIVLPRVVLAVYRRQELKPRYGIGADRRPGGSFLSVGCFLVRNPLVRKGVSQIAEISH